MKIIKKGNNPKKELRKAEVTCPHCNAVLEVAEKDFTLVFPDPPHATLTYTATCLCCHDNIVLNGYKYDTLFM